jgi:hypothetical protein
MKLYTYKTQKKIKWGTGFATITAVIWAIALLLGIMVMLWNR